jgi:hypothetical protein
MAGPPERPRAVRGQSARCVRPGLPGLPACSGLQLQHCVSTRAAAQPPPGRRCPARGARRRQIAGRAQLPGPAQRLHPPQARRRSPGPRPGPRAAYPPSHEGRAQGRVRGRGEGRAVLHCTHQSPRCGHHGRTKVTHLPPAKIPIAAHMGRVPCAQLTSLLRLSRRYRCQSLRTTIAQPVRPAVGAAACQTHTRSLHGRGLTGYGRRGGRSAPPCTAGAARPRATGASRQQRPSAAGHYGGQQRAGRPVRRPDVMGH